MRLTTLYKDYDKAEPVKTHQTCPICHHEGCYSTWPDGSGYCHSCGAKVAGTEKGQREAATVAQHVFSQLNIQKIDHSIRGLLPATMEFYGVKYECKDDGTPVAYRFSRPDNTVLHRSVNAKEFWFSGTADDARLPLFGSDRFSPGQKTVTITEGYFDALSVYQMFGSKYPAVAVQSASSAKAECSRAWDYLNSFDKIYLAFDADEPGQKAAEAVARLFDFNKVYLVKLDSELKDANGYLQGNKTDEFVKSWWNSKRFLPEGIISSNKEFAEIIDADVLKPGTEYPFGKLQGMTGGYRPGEFILVTAQEGIGKTEVIRSIEYKALKDTDFNIGVIHLEEGKARTLKGFAGLELERPIHLPEYSIPNDDIKKALSKVTRRDDRLHLYSHFGSDDPDVILSTVRWMAGACQCRVVFLDHITMVVTGLFGDDERRALDYVSTQLKMMAQSLDFTIIVVSHVNDEGLTRGSRNISKVADLRVDLDRNIKAESEILRNTTFMTVSKNRFTGKTGPAGALQFDPETFILSEADEHVPF